MTLYKKFTKEKIDNILRDVFIDKEEKLPRRFCMYVFFHTKEEEDNFFEEFDLKMKEGIENYYGKEL